MMVINVIGWIGAAMILGAYCGLSLGKMRPGVLFQSLNLFGAGGLGVSSLVKEAYPAMTLNFVWTAIALGALLRIAHRRRRHPHPTTS